MKKFKLSVHQYRLRLEKQFGFADPEMVQRYANARHEYKSGKSIDRGFNPFTEDPNCKSCKKTKTK